MNTPASFVLENARVWTGDVSPDSDDTPAEFIAIKDGRFLHVGPHRSDLIGPATVRFDAGGRLILPGFIDSHTHMMPGGFMLDQVQLRDAKDKNEFVQRIADRAATMPDDAWMLGGWWTERHWDNPQTPRRDWIDPVTRNHPVCLTQIDGHSVLCNSVALKLAGITHDGPDNPPGGVIERDPVTGQPTGILRESAVQLVKKLIPDPTTSQQVDALKRAMQHAAQHGITAVGDIPTLDDLPAYEQLALESPNEMSTRFFLYPFARDWSKVLDVVRTFDSRPGWIEIRGIKTFLDGALGSQTAYMHRPYKSDDPNATWRGLLMDGIDGGGLERNLAVARDAGLQPMAHAIGDEANRILLDAYEQVYHTTEAIRKARCRAEHAQHLLSDDIERFGRLGVIASMQPYHRVDDVPLIKKHLDAETIQTSYAFQSLLDAGAVLALGSDWPIATLDPFTTIMAATTPPTNDLPWQCITIEQALRAYTNGAAYSLIADHQIGKIASGHCADFVVLNQQPASQTDPINQSLDKIDWSEIHPDAVFVEGRCVHGSV